MESSAFPSPYLRSAQSPEAYQSVKISTGPIVIENNLYQKAIARRENREKKALESV